MEIDKVGAILFKVSHSLCIIVFCVEQYSFHNCIVNNVMLFLSCSNQRKGIFLADQEVMADKV